MYHYEVLGEQRFQHFCQSLIVASFPNTQCLPVGQPDGGRDAFLVQHYWRHPELRAAGQDLLVYQVKFIKNPADSRSERDMIEDVVKLEAAKIARLKERGLKKYYLITNLKGTSHPDVGSIDKVNALLSEMLGIEAYCWWRDDLDRRLDLNSNLKWSYPDILKATDLLAQLVAGQLGEDEERRRNAVRAYMTAQYEDDQELKFKQTELRSTMAELFVDLPMRHSFNSYEFEEIRSGSAAPRPVNVQSWARFQYSNYHDDSVPAASYFIRAGQSSSPNRIVLEGAPGQGKSTVTQYVSQVLRMHLIGKSKELSALPAYCQRAMVRIPFRVDLRDLAKWISGIDPFQSPTVSLLDSEPRSLEGFLAGQVRALSGGHTFSVSDLTAVAKVSHILLALDGFDEVADIELRQRLVQEITKGTNRLSNTGSFSVHTIVTSRPAAFAKSVRFPHETWTYFELLPLERANVDEYTGKWMDAKGLKNNEKTQIRQILSTKLQEPHTQYLAKNPMQLTILLSLVASRGPSLPEKRTALYDLYMEMFFSRETEKSEVVRENRDLLIDIHRYLAWKLQASAEGGGNGSIDQMSLRTTLYEYLYREGEDATIVDALFNGIIERVGALVSRVQGTFEFEVQPLREYFAARHLYETAPYPAIDMDVSGDKLDRFNALVCNPYWLNVARFYGGCFNKGEIMTLVNELSELAASPPLENTSHPRSFALMLLSDWVFTQYQPAVKAVIAFITAQPQFFQLLANNDTGMGGWSSLADRSGRKEFLEVLWGYAVKARGLDQIRSLCAAIVQNSSVAERFEGWLALREDMTPYRWAHFGTLLDVLQAGIFKNFDDVPDVTPELISALVKVQRFDVLASDEVFEAARDELRNSVIVYRVDPSENSGCRLQWLARTLSYYQYTIAIFREEALPFHEVLNRQLGPLFNSDEEIGYLSRKGIDELPRLEKIAAQAYLDFVGCDATILSTEIEPWANLVNALRDAWGDCAAIDRIAFVAAGIRNSSEGGSPISIEGASDLVGAARFARLKSGAPLWWSEQLEKASNSRERQRLLLLLLMWGTPRTLGKIFDRLENFLENLASEDWADLNRDYQLVANRLNGKGFLEILDIEALAKRSSRLCCFLGQRLDGSDAFKLSRLLLCEASNLAVPERNFVYRSIAHGMRLGLDWGSVLPSISELYLEGCSASLPMHKDMSLDKTIAEIVSKAPDKYPLNLVAQADAAFRAYAGAETASLMELAERDGWFKVAS
ncbi:hypothetical protein BV97_05758 [Novosphingobium resinovorum]|uniref:NACHT domain-containing protein n=1 Tax=Novosphingobium resinovorum TaxID=158500 RepID=A0A031IYQ5_9SPHN|nr:hypothetical protein [Novosphingobium resinovorum]EZP66363.1 hypothetical protein BV97_05758 [Novosphingobium resinovorum]